MGRVGNWSARKRDEQRRRLVTEGRAMARELTLYQHTAAQLQGRLGPDFFRMNPCETLRVFRFQVVATCMCCGAAREVTARDLDDTPWAHRHWPAVMNELICPECDGYPGELRFSVDRGGDVGVITTQRECVLRVASGSPGITKPVDSIGAIDPFAQHDDGPAA